MPAVLGRKLDHDPFYGPLVHKECLKGISADGPWKEITVLGFLENKQCNACGIPFICDSCSQGFVDSTGKCDNCGKYSRLTKELVTEIRDKILSINSNQPT